MKVITYVHKGKVRNITLDDLRMLKVELTQAWEKTCRKCGKCCFDKSVSKKGVLFINYNKPCQYLKFIGRKAECSVYSDRFLKFDKCNTIPEAIYKRYLPADCPYVKSAFSYKAPVDNGNWYKKARKRLAVYRYDDDEAVAGTPTGGTINLPAKLPTRITSQQAEQLAREDLAKPKDWLRRRKENRLRQAGRAGMLDPREKTSYNIKPSGHQLGG